MLQRAVKEEASLTAGIRSKRADVEGAKTALQASSSRGAVLKALMDEKVRSAALHSLPELARRLIHPSALVLSLFFDLACG